MAEYQGPGTNTTNWWRELDDLRDHSLSAIAAEYSGLGPQVSAEKSLLQDAEVEVDLSYTHSVVPFYIDPNEQDVLHSLLEKRNVMYSLLGSFAEESEKEKAKAFSRALLESKSKVNKRKKFNTAEARRLEQTRRMERTFRESDIARRKRDDYSKILKADEEAHVSNPLLQSKYSLPNSQKKNRERNYVIAEAKTPIKSLNELRREYFKGSGWNLLSAKKTMNDEPVNENERLISLQDRVCKHVSTNDIWSADVSTHAGEMVFKTLTGAVLSDESEKRNVMCGGQQLALSSMNGKEVAFNGTENGKEVASNGTNGTNGTESAHAFGRSEVTNSTFDVSIESRSWAVWDHANAGNKEGGSSGDTYEATTTTTNPDRGGDQITDEWSGFVSSTSMSDD